MQEQDMFDFKPSPPKPGREYPIGGYAPGNYICNCVTCKKKFMGDKRAVQCEPCAEKATEEIEAPAASPVEEKPEGRLLTRMFQAQYGSRAMSKLIDEHIEEYFTRWPSYKDKLDYLEWYHLFLDFSDKLTESKPSPVIVIGEQNKKDGDDN